jgi:hypothetical protein
METTDWNNEEKNFEVNENRQSVYNTAAEPCFHFGNKT